MPIPLSAPEILDRAYLEVRAKLLEIAASLDRLDRAEGNVSDDPRLARIREGLRIIERSRPDRAEQIQLLFSLPYDEGWQQAFSLAPAPGGNGRR
jgi:hypothetical protein